jgi:hypothetical protein
VFLLQLYAVTTRLCGLTACVTVNKETVQDMPSGYLCSLLNPDAWISTASEKKAIFQELKKRNEDCILPQGTSK